MLVIQVDVVCFKLLQGLGKLGFDKLGIAADLEPRQVEAELCRQKDLVAVSGA